MRNAKIIEYMLRKGRYTTLQYVTFGPVEVKKTKHSAALMDFQWIVGRIVSQWWGRK